MNPADTHSCSYQCERPICIRRQRDELYTAILLQEPGFTAADMADQYATAFERGRESVLAEQAAAAQEAVAWMTHHDEPMLYPTFAEAAAYCDDGEPPIPLYAASVAAAPVVVPMTNGYVQPVPDKCDRIVWRGRYYHLPVSSQSTPAAPVIDHAKLNELLHAAGDAAAVLQNTAAPLGQETSRRLYAALNAFLATLMEKKQ